MKKLLLVDDQVSFLKMLSIKLEKMGYTVVTAENGLEGLKKARAEIPDLIVIDIMMPVLDGFSAVEEIKKDERTAAIPVIFLSAKGQENDRVRARELGAADFIAKPFSPRLLIDLIERHAGIPR